MTLLFCAVVVVLAVLNSLFHNRGFARQPCCMAGTIDSFSYGNKCSFFCKTISLFLTCNMAAVQNLYSSNEQKQKRVRFTFVYISIIIQLLRSI